MIRVIKRKSCMSNKEFYLMSTQIMSNKEFWLCLHTTNWLHLTHAEHHWFTSLVHNSLKTACTISLKLMFHVITYCEETTLLRLCAVCLESLKLSLMCVTRNFATIYLPSTLTSYMCKQSYETNTNIFCNYLLCVAVFKWFRWFWVIWVII